MINVELDDDFIEQIDTFNLLLDSGVRSYNALLKRFPSIEVVEEFDRSVPGVPSSEFGDAIPPELVRVVKFRIRRSAVESQIT